MIPPKRPPRSDRGEKPGNPHAGLDRAYRIGIISGETFLNSGPAGCPPAGSVDGPGLSLGVRLARISHKGKYPNKMSGVKRLSVKDLPNGRVLTKPQHCAP